MNFGFLGAAVAMGIAAIGSAIGIGIAGSAAIGAWKKCYAANRPAPFLLLSFVGAPITQTLYGMILMFIMLGKTSAPGAGVPCLVAGIFAGLAIGLSALFQGRAGAAACDAQAETSQGFTNYLAALGIIETVAIFAMVFALIALGSIETPKAQSPAADAPAALTLGS